MSNAVVHCMPQRQRRPASILARPWPRLAGSAVRLGRPSDPHLATLSHHRAVARPRIRLTEVYVHLRARSDPRAARDLPGAAPPELLGGAAEGAGAALVAAGGGRTPSPGCRWRRSPSGSGLAERHSAGVGLMRTTDPRPRLAGSAVRRLRAWRSAPRHRAAWLRWFVRARRSGRHGIRTLAFRTGPTPMANAVFVMTCGTRASGKITHLSDVPARNSRYSDASTRNSIPRSVPRTSRICCLAFAAWLHTSAERPWLRHEQGDEPRVSNETLDRCGGMTCGRWTL